MSNSSLIAQLYIGYFNRAPDPAGLDYWLGLLAGGTSLNEIARQFASQPESAAIYGAPATAGFDSESFVVKVYRNLFSRDPEPAGLAFWKAALDSGALTPDAVILAAQGAANAAGSGLDFETLANKTAVALAYANAAVAAGGAFDPEASRDLLAGVDGSPESLALALAAVAGLSDQLPSSPPGGSGAPNSSPVAVDDVAVVDRAGFAFDPVSGHFYKYVPVSSSASGSWTISNFQAGSLGTTGGYLVTITSARENDFVARLLPENTTAWLALIESSSNDSWRIPHGPADERNRIIWRDGATVAGEFTNWKPGEPDLSRSNAAYISPDGGWADTPSNNAGNIVKGYVIEYGGRDQDLITVKQNATATLNPALLIANDRDPDGDALSLTAVSAVSEKGAAVALQGGTIIYDPRQVAELISLPNGERVADSFTYKVSDGHGGTAQGRVSLTLAGVNDTAVIGGDDSGRLEEDSVTPAGRSASGRLTVSDPDRSQSSFAPVDIQGTYGRLSLTADGQWTATLDNDSDAVQRLREGQEGVDAFRVTSVDGTAKTITISVAGRNDAPRAVDDMLSSAYGDLASLGFTAGSNGHFYRYESVAVAAGTASAAAAAGLGYLATITSAVENDLIRGLLPQGGVAWFSASDAAVEGEWRITDGPEAGTLFWTGGVDGTPSGFANWRRDAPNDAAAGTGAPEDYVYIQEVDGTWNDYSEAIGYIVEIGGRPQDILDPREDRVLTFSAASLLRNDTDIDGDTLRVTAVGDAAGKSLKGAAVSLDNGVITYDPRTASQIRALAEGETTTDSFSYTVRDTLGLESTATVTITVVGVADSLG